MLIIQPIGQTYNPFSWPGSSLQIGYHNYIRLESAQIVSKLGERDQQEVAGYYETLNLIGESYRDISISESSIKYLHNTLVKYSVKDSYHKGSYKINTNRVGRTEAHGSKTPIFEITPPGWATQDAMAQLVGWYNNDLSTHALIRVAIFEYEFLSIHPFRDGNGYRVVGKCR